MSADEALVPKHLAQSQGLSFVRTFALRLASLAMFSLLGVACSGFPTVTPTPIPIPFHPDATSPTTASVNPSSQFPTLTQVSVGEDSCGLSPEGRVVCWDDSRVSTLRRTGFRQVAAGDGFACARQKDGIVTCWGDDFYERGTSPEGRFTMVSAGYDHSCALDDAGHAYCWRKDWPGRIDGPADIVFTTVAAGGRHSCGLTGNQELRCWGDNDRGQSNFQAGPFRGLAVGKNYTCVLETEGRVLCQGDNRAGQSSPPPGAFEQIAAGEHLTCGVRVDRSLECWGGGFGPGLGVPAGQFTAVSVGFGRVCGLTVAGLPQCWRYGPDSPEPQVETLPAEGEAISFASPVALFPWPGGGLAVVEREGLIALCHLVPDFPCRRGATQTVLDLVERTDCCEGEAGLLDAALDPQFDRFPYLYAYYNVRGAGKKIRLSRFPVVNDQADLAGELVILELPMPKAEHYGGSVRFGPDGLLYLGIGENMAAESSQDLTTLRGKIIRIDVRGATPEQPYAIPQDNPFLATTAAARPEIWAYGLRNPWRMSFDAAGRLWVGDVGDWWPEGASIVTAGANLGWPVFEVGLCLVAERECAAMADAVPPVATYGRDEGCAIIWGGQYRGAALPELGGSYLFGDFCSGRVWALAGDEATGWQKQVLGNTGGPIISFGSDADGEMYVLSVNRPIRTVAEALQAGQGDDNPDAGP